ncbi:MAG: class I SAM-dependent methyltransferase, partial [Elusimicrobia bacterium]|nr:class I SAM-dependent methyltransferase [Elusimicrobiota bacterium]
RRLQMPDNALAAPDVSRSLKVAKMYEYGWSIYSKVAEEYKREFDDVIDQHLSPGDFKGKLVLDAGCGMGRFTCFSALYGAREIVGFDLSEAVVTAQHDTFRGKENAHFFQGDIYYLPLKAGSFDIVYSIGVIHHLPDPAQGVARLSALVRPGGKLFLWVYGHSAVKYPLNMLRFFTLRLPFRAVRALSFFPALFLYLINGFYRLAAKIPLTRPLAEYIPFHQYSDRSFAGVRWITQDHLTVPIINYFKRSDLEAWLKALPLKNTLITCRYPGKAGRSWRFSGEMPA